VIGRGRGRGRDGDGDGDVRAEKRGARGGDELGKWSGEVGAWPSGVCTDGVEGTEEVRGTPGAGGVEETPAEGFASTPGVTAGGSKPLRHRV
jgi:hypothetical protein